jgi:putative heme iron utilization protein
MRGTQVADISKPDPALAARRLLRAAKHATLATNDEGQPFASLITPATAADASVLMLLSGLSPHTRHLRAEPRCSILCLGPPTGPNPQTAPRLTLIGRAQPEPDPAAKSRWLARHPYAAFYAGLGDFQLWRFRAAAGQFVGGFASAHRLQQPGLSPPPDASAAIEAAEAEIAAHCNADHPDVMDLLAAAHGGAGEGWRMVACDPDGCDLAREEDVVRVPWPASAASATDVRNCLIGLADAARNPVATNPGPAV